MRKRGGAEDPDIIDAEKGRVGTTTTATSLSTADQDQDRDHDYDYEDVNEKGDRKKPSEQAKVRAKLRNHSFNSEAYSY